MFQAPAVLELAWAACALCGLGSGPGTWLHRVSRLPAWAWLPLVALAGCLVAYLLFFVYLFSPGAGRLAVRLSWVASVAVFAWCCRNADTRERLRERDAWVPLLLTVLLTGAFLASAAAMPVTVNNRFRFPLPADNLFRTSLPSTCPTAYTASASRRRRSISIGEVAIVHRCRRQSR